jgi:subtilisin family serine protease
MNSRTSSTFAKAGIAGATLLAAVAVFLVTFQWHQGSNVSTSVSESDDRVSAILNSFGDQPSLQSGMPGGPTDDLPGLRDRVSGNGRVRVIVELRIENEPGTKGLEGVQAYRDSIASVQQTVASTLSADSTTLATMQSLPLMIIEADSQGLEELAASEHVVRVMEDRREYHTVTDTVPLIGATDLINQGMDGHGYAVAVLDTGVEASHPFLGGRVVAEACFSSNVPGETTSLCPGGADEEIGPGTASYCPAHIDGCEHGTHVAGIAAGLSNIDSGVAPGANIVAVQVFSEAVTDCPPGMESCITTWISDTIRALEWVHSVAAEYNIAAVNMSLGGSSYTDQATCDSDQFARKYAIDQLLAAGVITVAAAGNEGTKNAMGTPGCISSVVSVGATDNNDTVADFSNSAPFLSLLAPGVDIDSSVLNGQYGIISGTSMATPHVAGAIALLRSAAPEATGLQIVNALRSTGVMVYDPASGVTTPRIQVMAAYEALTSIPVVDPAPQPEPTQDPNPNPNPNPQPQPAPVYGPANDDWQNATPSGTAGSMTSSIPPPPPRRATNPPSSQPHGARTAAAATTRSGTASRRRPTAGSPSTPGAATTTPSSPSTTTARTTGTSLAAPTTPTTHTI